MKRLLMLLVCTGLLEMVSAQVKKNGKISLMVTNLQNNPMENASVELLKSKDSSLLKTAFTDKTGMAVLEKLPAGTFIIKVTMISYAPQYSAPVTLNPEKNEIQAPAMILQSRQGEMKEVAVTARKPFIQRLSDRIVVNVDNSIVSSGSSAMDVLDRSPGVTVDQNDAISLRGKAGVIIMIDGKSTPMAGADLANFLKGLPASTIERIDIITNPSAKYDASGNSGIIDIHMKKDQRLGINGTVTAAYGQGIYPKANSGATFNYRNKRINLFGNYNYAYRMGLNHLILDRNFYNNGVFSGEDKKDNYTTFPYHVNTTRVGADLFLNNKTILGFVVNGNFAHFNQLNDNTSVVIDNQHQPSYTFKTTQNSNSNNNNAVGNINYKHTFDSAGKELTADVDYGVFNSNAISNNATAYFKLSGAPFQQPYVLTGNQDGKLTLQTAKVDYVNPLHNGSKFEMGLKTSYVTADNDAKFFDASTGTPQNDTTKTNHFIYKEYNNAGYLNYSREFKKFDITLGLRGEHTTLKTYQVKGNERFDSSYLKIFPSAFFNYKLTPDKTIGLSVSRRIDRPNYNSLNPFLFLIDVSTYYTGNTALLPQFTWSYELSYTVKNLNFSASYSHATDVENIAIAKFRDVFPNSHFADSNITVQIPVNLASSDYYGVSIAAPMRIRPWWNTVTNADLYYNRFKGNLGGSNLNSGAPAASIKTNNAFTFKKGWTAELNASFYSGGRDGYMVSKPQWGLSSGVQKTVLKNKGTLRFNITDIFWTNLPHATITYPGKYIENWHAYRESRVGTLSFTYRFGRNTVQAARKRTTGSEEERQRAQ